MKHIEEFLYGDLINEVLDPNSMKFYDWTVIEKSDQHRFGGTLIDYQVTFTTDSGKEYVISFNRVPKAKNILTRVFFMAEIKNGRKSFKTMSFRRVRLLEYLELLFVFTRLIKKRWG